MVIKEIDQTKQMIESENRLIDTENKSGGITVLMVVLMFSVELTAYLQHWIEKSMSQILLYAVVYVCMFRYSLKHGITTKSGAFWPILYVYIFLLLTRIFIDFIIPNQGFFLYKTPETILFFFFSSILIPSIFFKIYRFEFDVKKAVFYIGIVLLLCMLSSISDILSGNIVQDNDGRYQTAVFSIGFGQYSLSLLLIGIYLIKNDKRKKFRILMAILFMVVGAVGLIFSGSRGPFVAAIICIGIWYVCDIKNTVWLFFAILLVVVISLIFEDAMMALNDYLKSEGIRSFDRVVTSMFDDKGLAGHTSSRDGLYVEAWNYFLEKPFIGYSYLIPGKIYAHNIIVEQFMATGVFGGLAFVTLNIIAIIKGIKIMRTDKYFAIIPLLYIQYFIYGCLSVTILSLFPYWLFLLLTINKTDTLALNGK